MSLTAATVNAASGLMATARGTQVVSDNLANLNTPDYARQELRQTAVVLGRAGGVRVDGIDRIVDESLLSEIRNVSSTASKENRKAEFYKSIEAAVGISGAEASLEKNLLNLRESIVDATRTPNDTLSLKKIALAATKLTDKLSAVSQVIRGEAAYAGSQIKSDVLRLNHQIEQVATLNRKIARAKNDDLKTANLLDKRDKLINEMSEILPLKSRARPNNSVALITDNGIPLLDGQLKAKLEYAENSTDIKVRYANGTSEGASGSEQKQISKIWESGGRLGENIKIQQVYTAKLQAHIDGITANLFESFRHASKIGETDAYGESLFTLKENSAGIKELAVNPAVYNDGNEENLWKLRSNASAETSHEKGQSSKLQKYAAALSDRRLAETRPEGGEQPPLLEEIVSLMSEVSTNRLDAEGQAASIGAQALSLNAVKAGLGVDSDAELQRLIGYERAYAANAHVMRVIQDMFEQLQRW